MVTVSHMVENIVSSRPILHEAMQQGIISYGNLAEQIIPEIEKELNKKIKHSAVVMALRRYAEKIDKIMAKPRFDYHSELIMKTRIVDIAIVKSPELYKKLNKLYSLIDYEKGDMLNVIQGNYETSIVTNMQYLEKIKKELKGLKILDIEKNLVALSLKFSKKFIHTPGVISAAARKLTWEDVNIYELISTFTELTFIISEKDATKGYNALQRLVEQK